MDSRGEERAMSSKLAVSPHVIAAFIAIFSFIVLSGTQSFAGPFTSYPGARARAMGGAFTGIADDTSAVWFNPAGFAREKGDEKSIEFIIDWSQATSIDEEDGPLRSDETAWFVGGKFNHEKFGTGLFYYTPYSIRYWAHDQGNNDTAYGKVNEVVQIIGAPLAVSFFKGILKIGATLEWVHLGIHDSRVLYRDSWGWLDAYPTAGESADGFTGSLGTLISIMNTRSSNLKVGGTYRLKSFTDIGAEAVQADKNEAVERLFFDRPESFDLGISFTKAFPEKKSHVVLSSQYGRTDWGGARKGDWDLKYTRISIGAEYAIDDRDAILKTKALRVGYYTSSPSEQGRVWNWPDVNAITYGIGISVGYDSVRFGLDLTQERRSTKDDFGYSDKTTLTSLALTCTF